MAEMKRFSVWLAHQVYERKYSDKIIMESMKAIWGVTDWNWAHDQITRVRNDPKLFKKMRS